MEKKVVIITGASSGMGKEAALLLLQDHWTVYACARRTGEMTEIAGKGGNIVPLDVTDEASMVSCVNTVLEKEGQIDVLVNNAGYGSCGSIEEIPMEEVRNQYEVNVFGLGRMTQLVLPAMRRQRSGRIVNISSMGGRFTTPYGGWYHSTKYAVESISDALRMEVRPWNIEVVLVEPGMIQTNWGVIAAGNIRKFSGNGAYAAEASKASEYYETHYNPSSGDLTSPAVVGRTIYKACVVANPKTRYRIGRYAVLLTTLKKYLSDNMFQSIVRRSMGL